jgi:hypothetical protein
VIFGPEAEQALLEIEAARARRWWSAVMLASRRDVCRSILRGRPVRVDQLEAAPLRRALRGATPPVDTDYITVNDDMLDAVDEAGPFVVVKDGRR